MTKVADIKYFMKKIFDKNNYHIKIINKNNEILYDDPKDFITKFNFYDTKIIKLNKIIELIKDNIKSIEDIHIDKISMQGILFPIIIEVCIIKVDQSLEALIKLTLI